MGFHFCWLSLPFSPCALIPLVKQLPQGAVLALVIKVNAVLPDFAVIIMTWSVTYLKKNHYLGIRNRENEDWGKVITLNFPSW